MQHQGVDGRLECLKLCRHASVERFTRKFVTDRFLEIENEGKGLRRGEFLDGPDADDIVEEKGCLRCFSSLRRSSKTRSVSSAIVCPTGFVNRFF
ncbi:MAG: hypothetical protein MZU91_00465 [Desulfosudis oleivorans]|nr:hypothetical protein [Desulfosudis oleivorans]